MAHQHPCLYCFDLDRPRTSEHVLQKGFGTNMTLPDDVCDHCNTKVFSPLDHQLLNFIRTYVCADHPDVGPKRSIFQDGHNLWFDPASQLWLNVLLSSTAKPLLMTQMVFLDDSRVQVIMDSGPNTDWDVQLRQIEGELSRPEHLSVKHWVPPPVDAGKPPMQAALIRSGRNKYMVRGRDQTEVERLTESVTSGRLGRGFKRESGPQYSEHLQPGITHHTQIAFGDIARALYKTGLNFLCAVAGPDVARRTAFDPVRKYALTGDGPAPTITFLTGPLARDGQEFGRRLAPMTGPRAHSLLLFVIRGTPSVAVSLYGKPVALVPLVYASAPGALAEATQVLTTFDFVARTHQTLRQ